jgi:uncharacterized Zn-finger protein
MPFRCCYNGWIWNLTAKWEGSWFIRKDDLPDYDPNDVAFTDLDKELLATKGFLASSDLSDIDEHIPMPAVKPPREHPRVFIELDWEGIVDHVDESEPSCQVPRWVCLYCNKSYQEGDPRILPSYPSCPCCKGHLHSLPEFLDTADKV